MSESKITPTRRSFSLDWLMRGVLTKLGETFDKLTGRNWKPSSSLATSELAERLKFLLDAEAKDTGDNKKFVPHNIKLKTQWDKFSTDSETALRKLEDELLIAAIDHINDKRYHTFAPMNLEIKPDYFTEGVKLFASFDHFDEEKREAAINVTVPDLKNVLLNPQPEVPAAPEKELFTAEFTIKDEVRKKELAFASRERLSVGRTKENDLWLDDASVSKVHAALVLNSENQLMVADTGSTNGTFINDQRIAYGKAIQIKSGDKLKFGTVEVALNRIAKAVEQKEIYAENTVLTRENFSTNKNFEVQANISRNDENLIDKNAAVQIKLSNLSNAESDENISQTEQRVVLDSDKQ
ncbi:MAG: FHA domain-containing protein [Acidobacteriota bacterium]|nr:FHA domain-containing protein [Acidobacteriota bacterium]